MGNAYITRREWTAENLPEGLTLSKAGKLTGKPTEAGVYDVPVTVETNWGSATKNINIKVESVDWTAYDFAPTGLFTVRSGPSFKLCILQNGNLGVPVTRASNGYVGMFSISDLTKTFTNTSPSSSSIAILFGDYNGSSTTTLAANVTKIYGTVPAHKGTSTSASSLKYCVLLSYSLNDRIYRISNNNGGQNIKSPSPSTDYVAAINYNSTSYKMLVFSKNGDVHVSTNFPTTSGSATFNNVYSTGIKNINPMCAQAGALNWDLCVTSSNKKSAVSTDEGVTWQVADTPDNFVELYESSTGGGNWFARGEETKLFYYSKDGLNWEQYNNTPIPLQTVKSGFYGGSILSEAGYCAIGTGEDGTERYAAITHDFENWRYTKITNDKITFKNIVFSYACDAYVTVGETKNLKYIYALERSEYLK